MKKKKDTINTKETSLKVVKNKQRFKKVVSFIKNKVLKSTTQTVILILALIAIFIGLNLWVKTMDLPVVDITKEQLYSLSEDSKKQVAKVEQNINIYLFGYEDGNTLIDLAKQYSYVNEKIKVEIVDISQRADLAEKYEVTAQDIGIVVESEERSKIISSYDMYTYDYTTYQTIDISEEKLTNAIIETTLEEKPKIYFLTGHGEYSLDSEMTIFKLYLENESNDVEKLDLLVSQAIPEDADLLVIASPTKDITEYEAGIITNYVNNGGKILSLQDPTYLNTSFTNLQKIFDLFGVKVENGVIMEQDANQMLLSAPNYIIPTMEYHQVTEDIQTDGGIVIRNSGRLSFVNSEEYEGLGITVKNILQTTDKAYFRTNLNVNTIDKINSDTEGMCTLGAEIQKTIDENITSTLVIYSSGDFVSDAVITIGEQTSCMIYMKNNRDFILNTTAYLTEREDGIRIRKDTGAVTYTPSESEDTVVKIIIFTIPVIIIIIGIIVWQKRRRKK